MAVAAGVVVATGCLLEIDRSRIGDDSSEGGALDDRAGDLLHALSDCDQVVAMSELTSEHRGVAEECRRRLDPKVATIEVSGPATMTMRLDGGSAQILPVRVRVTPGRHVVVVESLTSRTMSNEVFDVAAGEHRKIAGREPVARPPAPPPSSTLPATFWAASGVALFGAAVTGTFGVLTVRAKNEFDERPSSDAADEFDRNKLTTNIALAVTAVAAVTAVYLWITAPTPKRAVSRPSPLRLKRGVSHS